MKKSSALTPKAKYFPLQEFLRVSASEGRKKVSLTIRQINNIVQTSGKGKLPASSYTYATFWGNDQAPTHVWKPAWLSNGYVVKETRNVLNSKKSNSTSDNGVVTFELI